MRFIFVLVIAAVAMVAQAPAQSLYGPQASIACPAGALSIAPGQDIPALVASAPAGASFCVRAGRHTPTAPINLKAGQRLVGEYGAIIDGARVSQGWDIPSTSIVRGWNCATDCSGVLVQNLVITNLQAYNCIGVYRAGNWVIDHVEVSRCEVGVNIGYQSGTRVTNSYMHHNNRGYGGNWLTDTVFERNDIAWNGFEQKLVESKRVTFRANRVHHNVNGLWLDGDNVDVTIEDNVLEDNSGIAVYYEISGRGVIRRNVVRRTGETGIFLSTSQDVEVTENDLSDNWRGITMLVNCKAVFPPGQPHATAIGWDLARNSVHRNAIRVGTRAGSYASSVTSVNCTAGQMAPYLSVAKRLTFAANTYVVPSLTAPWWPLGERVSTWSEWRAAGQDMTGTLSTGTVKQAVPPPPRADR